MPNRRDILQRFFKTRLGEYAEGDQFIGVMVPAIRKISKKFSDLSTHDTLCLLSSPVHEERLLALFIMIIQFNKSNNCIKEEIYFSYISHIQYVNHWDLVDQSAPFILGAFLLGRDKKLLFDFALSENLWKRRIAIVSTFSFIKAHELDPTIQIAELLLKDHRDLIHKAVGWMLREVGKKQQAVLENFLDQHGAAMPRTMLRYAIEKFPQEKRLSYLAKKRGTMNAMNKSIPME